MTSKEMGLSLVKVVPAYMSVRLAWLIIMRSGAWRERAILVSEFRRAVVGANFLLLVSSCDFDSARGLHTGGRG